MPLRVATYNAGLAVGVLPYASERAEQVLHALQSLEVDLLYVQEFWLEPHWQALRQRLSGGLQHVLRQAPTQPVKPGACTAKQVQPLVDCAKRWCVGLTDEALARCVVEHCAPAALSMPTPCLNCIASHPVGTLESIVGRCLSTEPDGPSRLPSAARYGGLMAYGGSFGTGLLSRLPFMESDQLVYESTVNARGALYVRLRLPEIGDLPVFATHFSPGGPEQPPQVERLLQWIDEKAPVGPALLLGDLNTSSTSALFDRIRQAGFSEAGEQDRRGTYTHDGLGTGDAASASLRLDYVLFRELSGSTRVERILDRAVDLQTEKGTVRTTLSDHFGLLATLSL